MAEHEAPEVTVIGGGLAGCEAAWQLATRGVRVRLIESQLCITLGNAIPAVRQVC